LIDAVWSVRAVRSNAVMTCRSTVNEPVSGGYDALVDGHRRALQQVTGQIASAVQAMAAAAVRGGATVASGGSSGKQATVVVPACPVAGAGATTAAAGG
jgi:hypothetical protein